MIFSVECPDPNWAQDEAQVEHSRSRDSEVEICQHIDRHPFTREVEILLLLIRTRHIIRAKEESNFTRNYKAESFC